MSLCLSQQELEELTDKVRPKAQIRALNCMGIDHKLRPNGSVVVFRSEVGSASPASESGAAMPNLEALNHVA